MLLNETLIARVGSRTRIYPVGPKPTVETHLGAARLAYITDDMYVGVQLNGETRVDEYPMAQVTIDRFVVALHSGDDVAYIAIDGREQSEYGFTFERADAREFATRGEAAQVIRSLRKSWPGQRFVMEVAS